jgi:hypothetical protein
MIMNNLNDSAQASGRQSLINYSFFLDNLSNTDIVRYINIYKMDIV